MDAVGTQKTTSDSAVVVDCQVSDDFGGKKKKTFGQGFFLGQAIFWLISGFLYSFSVGLGSEKFFSRMFLSIMCYGIYEILSAIKSQNSR